MSHNAELDVTFKIKEKNCIFPLPFFFFFFFLSQEEYPCMTLNQKTALTTFYQASRFMQIYLGNLHYESHVFLQVDPF